MRPYLAIIKDAFRAALATRVLYVLLFLITVVLVVVAPLHVYETLDWQIVGLEHIPDTNALAKRVVDQRERQPIVGRIFDRLPETVRADLQQKSQATDEKTEPQQDDEIDAPRRPRRRGGPPRRFDQAAEDLAKALNAIIEQKDFYDAELWKGKFLNAEAQQLVDTGVDQLSEIQRKRLHRLLITAALAPDLQPASSTYLDTYYAIWRVPFLSAPMTLQQFGQNATATISFIFDKFVLSIGLFIAILVTSNMIPETFEPGSLNLLLSKPIHRWGLLVSKFLGGCAFVSLLAVYLFLGIWLWLGLAIGIWDRAMLWSIPLYILVFAIYFSVSVLVGVIYRSAVVSVILTALFWAFCFTIGTVYGMLNVKMENERLVRAVDLGDQVVAVDAVQRMFIWNKDQQQWDSRIKPTFNDPGQEVGIGIAMFFGEMPPFPVVTPSYDPAQQHSFAMSASIFDPESMGQQKLYWATDPALTFTNLGVVPHAAMQLLHTNQGMILVGGDGAFYRLALPKSLADAESASSPTPTSPPTNPPSVGNAPSPNSSSGAAGIKLNQYLVKCGPNEPQPAAGPEAVAFHAPTNEIFVYRRGQLYAFALNDRQEYQLTRQKAVESGSTDPLLSCRLATGGDTVLLVFGNGQIVSLRAGSFEEINGYRCESRSPAIQVAGSPDGRWFAVLYRNGRTWILDNQKPEQMKVADIAFQGEHRGIYFDQNNQLLLCHSFDRVSRIDLANGQSQALLSPKGDFLKTSYRHVMRPFYKICPKPGEFYKLVNHLSTSTDTQVSTDVDLAETQNYQDPWSPLWTGLGFMTVCLFLACWYFHLSDY